MGAPSLHSMEVMAQPRGAKEKKGMATDWWLRRGLRWGAAERDGASVASSASRVSAITARVAASAAKAATPATAWEASRLAASSCSRIAALASIRRAADSTRSAFDQPASVATKASVPVAGIGWAAIRPRTSRPAEAKRAEAVLWSLRFMVNVLLGVFGVVGNYNTTGPGVNRESTQLKTWSGREQGGPWPGGLAARGNRPGRSWSKPAGATGCAFRAAAGRLPPPASAVTIVVSTGPDAGRTFQGVVPDEGTDARRRRAACRRRVRGRLRGCRAGHVHVVQRTRQGGLHDRPRCRPFDRAGRPGPGFRRVRACD